MNKQALLSLFALLLAVNIYAAQGGIRPAGQPVRDTYIVVLHSAPPAAIENTRNQLAATHGAKIIAVYDTVFQGFAMGGITRHC